MTRLPRQLKRGEPMKQYFGLGLAMLAGTAIGAAAVTGLHAQAKPPVYTVNEIDVTNEAAFVKEYLPLVRASIVKSGRNSSVSPNPQWAIDQGGQSRID